MSDFGALAIAPLGAITTPAALRLATPSAITTEGTTGVYSTPWGAKNAIPLPSLNAVIFTHGIEAMRYALEGASYRLGLLAPSAGFTAVSTAVRASCVLSVSGTPTDGDLIAMGDSTGGIGYCYLKNAIDTASATDQVLIGGSAANCVTNLQKFVNGTGTNGTEYFAGRWMIGGQPYEADLWQTRNKIECTSVDIVSATKTFTVKALAAGTAGNAYISTNTIDGGGVLTWASATFTGGTAGTGTDPADGSYSYAQAYLRRADGALSAIAQPFVDLDQEANCNVSLASIAALVSRDATDYKRWYRTSVGGRRFYRGNDVTGTTDTDNIPDDTMTDEVTRYQYDERIFRPRAAGYPVVGRYGVIWRGRLWVGGALKNADYADGTVAVTINTDTATLSTNGRCKEDMIGHWLRIAGHPIDYLIIDIAPATRVLTLHRNYAGGTDAAATYTIVDLRDPCALNYSEPVVTVPGQTYLAGVNNFAPTSNLPGIHSDDPEGIMAEAVIEDTLVVWTKTSLWRVVGNTGAFRLQHIADGCGAFSNQSVQSDGTYLYWLGPGGVFRWGGGGSLPTPLSKPTSDDPEGIQETIRSINGDEADIICSNYNPTTHRIRWWVPTDGATSNQKCLRLDLHTMGFALHTASDVTAACTVPGPSGTYVTVTGDAYGCLWQLDTGYVDGAYEFEPRQTVSSYTASTRTLAVTGTALPTSGSGLDGVPVLIVRPRTGAYQMAKVATNTTGAVVLAEPLATAPAAGDYAIFGGIPADISASRFDWQQPYLDKWIEAITLGHEVESAATEVWIGASADDADPSVFYSTAWAEADACLVDDPTGEFHFPIYTPRGKSLSYRLLAIGRGYRVRIRSMILSVRSPAVDEVEA